MIPRSWQDTMTSIVLSAMVVASAYAAYREAFAFLGQPIGREAQLKGLADGPPRQSLSTFGNRRNLDACLETLSDAANRLAEPDQMTSIAANCRQYAQDVIRHSPADSYAYAVAAYALAISGKQAQALSYLEKSRSIAAAEGWLSAVRLRQFREFHSQEIPAAIAGTYQMEQDILTLANTWPGLQWLARWFKADETGRPKIAAAIETLSPASQQSFIQLVRK